MLVLFETSLGYALFKCRKNDLGPVSDMDTLLSDPSKAGKLLKLKAFHRFADTVQALESMKLSNDGVIPESLSQFLKAEFKDSKEKLAMSDMKLSKIVSGKLGIETVGDSKLVLGVMRGIRLQLQNLMSKVNDREISDATLGLAHSLSRYKLQFSPDKIDTMVIQAIALLDDIDKEINVYSMRLREWYGWHFPELSKIVCDNIAYAHVVKRMGDRVNASATDFTGMLAEELAERVKSASIISIGTEISDEDLQNIVCLCDQLLSLCDYREELYEYLKNRMLSIAPNLTVLLGELVGARLISRAGSLVSLAKQPASTIQILGAEKALFRALKTKKNTPKYGLIFHASLVGQASNKIRGKIARVLAAKASLAIRVDALSDVDEKSVLSSELGQADKLKVERRLKELEMMILNKSVGSSRGKPPTTRPYEIIKPSQYNPSLDMVPLQTRYLNKDGKDKTVTESINDKKEEERGESTVEKESRKTSKRNRDSDIPSDTPQKVVKSKKSGKDTNKEKRVKKESESSKKDLAKTEASMDKNKGVTEKETLSACASMNDSAPKKKSKKSSLAKSSMHDKG